MDGDRVTVGYERMGCGLFFMGRYCLADYVLCMRQHDCLNLRSNGIMEVSHSLLLLTLITRTQRSINQPRSNALVLRLTPLPSL
jgi:hypothetical protein